jgi:hypothetical protein
MAAESNLLRAARSLASPAQAKARGATLCRDLIDVAAGPARHGRGHRTVHPPEGWHREHDDLGRGSWILEICLGAIAHRAMWGYGVDPPPP